MIQRMLKTAPFRAGVLPCSHPLGNIASEPDAYAASFLSLAGELGVAVTVRNGG
jgi:hypothetical protein